MFVQLISITWQTQTVGALLRVTTTRSERSLSRPSWLVLSASELRVLLVKIFVVIVIPQALNLVERWLELYCVGSTRTQPACGGKSQVPRTNSQRGVKETVKNAGTTSSLHLHQGYDGQVRFEVWDLGLP